MSTSNLILTSPQSGERQHADALLMRNELGIIEASVSRKPASKMPSYSARLFDSCVFAVAAVGFVISSYLAWIVSNNDQILGCSAGPWFSCNEVLYSRFAKVMGVPVSLLGAMVLGTIVVCLILRRGTDLQKRHWSDSTLMMAVSSAAGAGLWFIGLQIFYFQKGCLYCLAVHLCSLTVAIVMLRSAIYSRHDARHLLLGLVGVVVIASVQWFSLDPPTFQLIESEPSNGLVEVIDLELLTS